MARRVVLFAVLFLLNLPWLFTAFGMDQSWGLRGSEGPKPNSALGAEAPASAVHRWVEHFEANFWPRALLIRLRNQVQWTLFRKVHTQRVLVGPTDYLFERSYLEAARGDDLLDLDTLAARVHQLEEWQRESGSRFLVVLAPGKGSFVDPRHWPLEFQGEVATRPNGNYEAWRELLAESDRIELLDLWQQAAAQRTSDYTWFPKNGIHWSQFAITHATHALVERIPGLSLELGDTLETAPFGTDEDIEESLNLMLDLPDLPAYQQQRVWVASEPEQTPPPRVLVIGDSYACGPVREGLLAHSAPGSEFWYYNRQLYGPQVEEPGKLLQWHYGWRQRSHFLSTLGQFDLVIWLATDANLKTFPFQPVFLD